MLAGIIVGLLIAAWAAFVIVRKIRRAKQGIYCDCGCCGSSCSCCKEAAETDQNQNKENE